MRAVSASVLASASSASAVSARAASESALADASSGAVGLLPGRASLVERDDCSGDRPGECERDDGECNAEAFVLADSLGEAFSLCLFVGVALLSGGGEEFCFEGVEVVGVVLVPVEGLFEACAAVELSWVAVEAVP